AATHYYAATLMPKQLQPIEINLVCSSLKPTVQQQQAAEVGHGLQEANAQPTQSNSSSCSPAHSKKKHNMKNPSIASSVP
ncbi:hypothetical protein Dimus_026873, partial [Dionaea muscipula]